MAMKVRLKMKNRSQRYDINKPRLRYGPKYTTHFIFTAKLGGYTTLKYLVYLGSCLSLGLFMSYLCDLFFIFSLTFIVINSITSLKQTHLFFANILEYLDLLSDDNVDEEGE